ncbi:MAG: CRISPR-associated protein Cas2 [Betaproteobacteria bacterium CG2_30_68_42]|nr:MAG: CRISPR-associated protein Cas2 [Betaproteobacteria bacterium CG2_30_68_42]
MDTRDLFLASYDVADPMRLREALVLVKGHATGGQKSAYECFLSEGERAALVRDMTAVLDAREDAFFLLRLDPRAIVRALGIAVAPEDPPFFYYG